MTALKFRSLGKNLQLKVYASKRPKALKKVRSLLAKTGISLKLIRAKHPKKYQSKVVILLKRFLTASYCVPFHAMGKKGYTLKNGISFDSSG